MKLHSPVCPGLVRRFEQVAAIFILIMAVVLGATLAIGDGEIVTRVHFSHWVQSHYQLVLRFTDFGLYPFYFFFLGLLLYGHFRHETWMKLVGQAYWLAQFLGNALVVRLLKIVLGRARPDVTSLPGFESEWVGFILDSKYNSFPSGHTADIVTSALFMTLVVRNPWAAGLFIIWALALSLSRLALAKHYPSDALMACVIALVMTYFVLRYWLLPRLQQTPPFPLPNWWR